MCQIQGMRRDDICLYLGPAERAELKALIANRTLRPSSSGVPKVSRHEPAPYPAAVK